VNKLPAKNTCILLVYDNDTAGEPSIYIPDVVTWLCHFIYLSKLSMMIPWYLKPNHL